MLAEETVRAVNQLTGDWARIAVDKAPDGVDGGTVFSSAGVWPLLAVLAGGANGPARGELEAAVGLAGSVSPLAQGRAVIEALDAMDGVAAATGLWIRQGLVPVRRAWETALPPGVRGALTGDTEADRRELDGWAARHTAGAIDTMPVPVTPDTLLVLAGALLLRTTWTVPFRDGWMTPDHGPWRARQLHGLYQSGKDLDGVRIAHDTPAGPLTVAEIPGDNGLTVFLLLGSEGVAGGEVLHAGVGVLAGDCETRPGSALPPGEAGPGVTVREVTSWDATPTLTIATPQFTVRARHDLLRHAGLFGLRTAMDASRGHFPGISPVPLAVSSAQQAMTAAFTAKGFEAAAVTAFGIDASGVPMQRSMHVGACFDRPFGFLAVHRATGLVLAAGWVTDPDDIPDLSTL
ncbi:serpin family protein [Streptomyces sp. XD-27]|uniref:serpin family protein n=1 Tax=Streptomyces sp. XD-27 TaxID=3062779 RepID=UPI0026F43B67|nr:serpin family protein [Streptomyces sp. XD-27]WKX73291.1 serpin family protein [Streptomyces sp. XD-27]